MFRYALDETPQSLQVTWNFRKFIKNPILIGINPNFLYILQHVLIFLWSWSLHLQGGFVLHNTPVSGYAVCGCSNTSQTCSYLTPALTSSLNDVPTSVTFNSIDSFVNDFCSAFTNDDPNCHLLTSPSDWNQDYSGTLAACIDQVSCDLSQYQCQCVDSECQFGRTSPVVNSVPTATVWYNHKVLNVRLFIYFIISQAYHTAPVVLNSFYNLYLKSFNSNLSISVTNHPFTSSLTIEVRINNKNCMYINN